MLTSGTSYTTPVNCNSILVEVVGGGASGAGAPSNSANINGGSGGGEYVELRITSMAATYSYAVGDSDTEGYGIIIEEHYNY